MATRAGELLHLDYANSSDHPDVTLLLSGHCQLSTTRKAMRSLAGSRPHTPVRCALANHPTLPLLASASSDLTIRLWNVRERQMEAMRTLPVAAADLAFAPTSETLVCALGAAGLLILDASTLYDLLSFPCTAAVLAFSPNGTLLAVGAAGRIELRSTGGSWEVVGVCTAQMSAVKAIDWSSDSTAMQSDDEDGSIFFWDARSCSEMDGSTASDIVWSSASCVRQWALRGVPDALGHPSLLAATCRAHGSAVVACASRDGSVTLIGYPSVSPDAPALRYPEHCAALHAVAWSADDSVLLTLSHTGELFQWRHIGGDAGTELQQPTPPSADSTEMYDSDVEHELSLSSLPREQGGGAVTGTGLFSSGSTMASSGNAVGSDSVGAIVNAVEADLHAPTGWSLPVVGLEAPADGLALDWVYGCRGHDTHGSVRWTANGDFAFHAASVGCVYDPHAHAQRFFQGHSNDILCLAVHSSGLAVATGQAGGTTASSCVWDARTCEAISVLRGVHSIGVCAIQFDASGERLATCGLEPAHRIAVWDWRRGILLARVATGAHRLFALAFHPKPSHEFTAMPIEICAVGLRTASFVNGHPTAERPPPGGGGVLLRVKRGAWAGHSHQSTLLCVTYSAGGGECFTGTSRGEILVWRERTLARVIRAHAGPVFCITSVSGAVAKATGEPELLYSAGKGGKVRRWGVGMRSLGTLDLREAFAALTDTWGRPLISQGVRIAIRSLDVDGAGRVLLGTSGGEVALLVPSSGKLSLVLQGHSARRGARWPGCLAALATHPSKAIAATAGAEGSLRVWSLAQHCLLSSRPLAGVAGVACYSPDGLHLAVGLACGSWLLLDADSLKPCEGTAAAEAAFSLSSEHAALGAVCGLSFSPDGSMLAVGTADGCLAIYAHVSGGWECGWHRAATCTGHSGRVCQIDWSEEPVELSNLNVSRFEPVDDGARSGRPQTECWLLRTCADGWGGAEASGAENASSPPEMLHWELVCERAARGASGHAAAAVSSAGSRRVAHATAVRDISWASDTSSLCWGSSAVKCGADLLRPANESSLRLPAVSRSHEGEVLAAADVRGGVSLWRWPASSPNAMSKRFGGHAAAAAAVAFTHDDSMLLTCGGADLTLLQWRHVAEEASTLVVANSSSGSYADAYDSDVATDFVPASTIRTPHLSRGLPIPSSRRAFLEASSLAQAARATGDALSVFPSQQSPLAALAASSSLRAIDELVRKDRFRSVRPWLRGLEPPTATAGQASTSERAPLESLCLAWVHGARTHDARTQVHRTFSGQVVYACASLVVLLDTRSSKQRYYRGHDSAVLSTALHPDGTTIASGASGVEPSVHVWEVSTLQPLAILRGAHSVGVSSLAFSADGQYLASCDLAQLPLIALWGWRRGTLLASSRAGRRRIIGLSFIAGGALVSYGSGTLRFWVADGSKLTSRRGHCGSSFDDAARTRSGTILCVATTPDGEGILCGTADGCILTCHTASGQCVDVAPVNRQQPIFALQSSNEVGVMAAGKGGRLLWWPAAKRYDDFLSLSSPVELDLSSMLCAAGDAAGRPLAHLVGRAPCVGCIAASKEAIVLATRSGELWEVQWPELSRDAAVTLPVTQDTSTKLLVQGHSTPRRGQGQGEVCALAVDPTDPDLYATGGDDRTVRVWSIRRGKLLGMRVLPLPVTALAYTADGVHLAVGCAASGIYVLYADTLTDVLVFSLARSPTAATRHDALIRSTPPYGSGALVASSAPPIAPTGVITALAYSPDDRFLAVGVPGGDVEILAVGAHYRRYASTFVCPCQRPAFLIIFRVSLRRLYTCLGHSAAVLHLDWSEHGKYLQTCCARCEYMFWDAASGKRVVNFSELHDLRWASWSCPLGLPVQGIYPKMSDGSDINSVHRSPDGRLLVTCDEFRKVNLFRFPCGPGSAACHSVAAHAFHAAAVRFSADGKYVLSVGGADLAVMVWKVIAARGAESAVGA